MSLNQADSHEQTLLRREKPRFCSAASLTSSTFGSLVVATSPALYFPYLQIGTARELHEGQAHISHKDLI
jgi:hypothetical protein